MSQYTMNSGKITEAGQNVSIVSASMTDLPSNTVCSCGVSTIPALSSARIRWLRQTNVKRSAPNGPKKTSPSMISEGLVFNCIQYAASGSGSDVLFSPALAVFPLPSCKSQFGQRDLDHLVNGIVLVLPARPSGEPGRGFLPGFLGFLRLVIHESSPLRFSRNRHLL